MNTIAPNLDGKHLRIGIVQARFTNEIGSEMLKVCCRTLQELGVADENITVATVPGALEIPIALMNLASSEKFDALIAIGVVIRGEPRRTRLQHPDCQCRPDYRKRRTGNRTD